jgi:putative transcriptional regulator
VTNEELDFYSEEILDRVSANVKMYRERKGYSQMQLALEIGMSSGAYLGRAEIRKDNHHFNIKHLAKIAMVLDVPIAAFFKPTSPTTITI